MPGDMPDGIITPAIKHDKYCHARLDPVSSLPGGFPLSKLCRNDLFVIANDRRECGNLCIISDI